MKFSAALFAVITVCNCFNSIISAKLPAESPIAPQLPIDKSINDTGNVHSAPEDIQPLPHDNTTTTQKPSPSPDNTTTTEQPAPVPDNTTTTVNPVPDNTTTTVKPPTPVPDNTTTTVKPPPTPDNTTTTIKPGPVPDNTTTTTKPAPTPDNTTTTVKPAPVPDNTTTTTKPAPTPSTTVSPYITSTPAPHRNRFDGPSFIGGIVLSLGLVAIGFVGWKYYKARTERNYRTL